MLCFLESLRHCANVLVVWFARSNTVSDPAMRGEVSFIDNICDSTFFPL